MRNPTVAGKVDRALSQAQQALSELFVYGSSSPDRAEGDRIFQELEKIRWRLRRGR